MAKSDYVPWRDKDLVTWTRNLEKKITGYITLFGLTATQVSIIGSYCEAIQKAIAQNNLAQQTALNMRLNKDATIRKNVKNLRNAIRQWKTAAAYTNAIGVGLGISCKEEGDGANDLKPALRAQVITGFVALNFSKRGGMEGVNIYSRISGRTEWIKLGFDTHSPYMDNRPVAKGTVETREYMCIAIVNDEETGEQSDVVNVVVGE